MGGHWIANDTCVCMDVELLRWEECTRDAAKTYLSMRKLAKNRSALTHSWFSFSWMQSLLSIPLRSDRYIYDVTSVPSFACRWPPNFNSLIFNELISLIFLCIAYYFHAAYVLITTLPYCTVITNPYSQQCMKSPLPTSTCRNWGPLIFGEISCNIIINTK